MIHVVADGASAWAQCAVRVQDLNAAQAGLRQLPFGTVMSLPYPCFDFSDLTRIVQAPASAGRE